MDKQTQEARELTKSLPFKERVQNFWYYKKWWVVAAIVFVAVASLTVYEISVMPQYDLYVGYYSESPISDESLSKLKEILADYAIDTNEDGQVTISITPMQASRESENEQLTAVQTRLISELTSGENMMYICDKSYRDMLMTGNNAECFEDEFNMADNPTLKQKIRYIDDTLYVLLKEVYEREESDPKKRIEHNNAVNIVYALRNVNFSE